MTDYFSVEEQQCKCGCGMTWTSQFHARMNLIREEVGAPMTVTSGARCEAYDKSIGGAGPHRIGMACDIQCSGDHAHKILEVAMKYKMAGIGISQKGQHSKRFIHLDNTSYLRPWVWSY